MQTYRSAEWTQGTGQRGNLSARDGSSHASPLVGWPPRRFSRVLASSWWQGDSSAVQPRYRPSVPSLSSWPQLDPGGENKMVCCLFKIFVIKNIYFSDKYCCFDLLEFWQYFRHIHRSVDPYHTFPGKAQSIYCKIIIIHGILIFIYFMGLEQI